MRRPERRADRRRRLARRGPRRVLEPRQRVRRGRRALRGPQRRRRPRGQRRDPDLALPGSGLAEDRELPPLARGRRRAQQRQRHAGLLDGAPVQPVRRRLRRRRRELCGLHRLHRPRQPRTTASAPPTSSARAGWPTFATCSSTPAAAATNGTQCAATNGEPVWFRMYRAAVALQDDNDPVFSSPPAGSLLGGGPLAGAHGVSFAATDVGGGLQEAVIEVDGQRAAAHQPRLRPAVHRGRARASSRPRGRSRSTPPPLADGAHSVRVLVTDVERQQRGLRAVLDHDLERARRAARPRTPRT